MRAFGEINARGAAIAEILSLENEGRDSTVSGSPSRWNSKITCEQDAPYYAARKSRALESWLKIDYSQDRTKNDPLLDNDE